MKISVISQRVEFLSDRNETRDALDQRLISWITENGILAFPVPNNLIEVGQLESWLLKIKPDSIILSGGNNLGEYPQRDKTEEFLINYAKKNQLPLLGICRGMQMLGAFAGAKIQQVSGHVKTRNKLKPLNGGEWPVEVNSFHDFALSDCPSGFEVSAIAEDGVIEAIIHTTLPWEGWMWHPEREDKFSQVDGNRLRRLFGIK